MALGPTGLPSARLLVPGAARAVFDQLLAALPGGPYLERVREELAPRDGERWPDWFGRMLLCVFASSGLVVFEPRHAAALLRPMLLREIDAPDRVPAALRAAARVLLEHGLPAPLRTDAPSAVFLVDQNRRRRFDPGRDDARALRERAQSEPDLLSGDAGLRAILQALLLPAPAVVGGPGELAYWIQLSEAFDLLGAPRPVFLPRMHGTLVEPRVRRGVEDLGFGAADLFLGEEVLAQRLPAPDRDKDAALRDKAQDAFAAWERFAREFEGASGSLKKSLQKLTTAFQASLHKLSRQALEEQGERAGVSLRRALLVARSFSPAGKPQDRVLSGLQFLPRHGFDLYDRLAATIDPFEFGHQLVDLGDTEAPHG
ncbi:MAG: bacillithiol biosynthesis BshC [Planctomycetes bacterium]|nr:bacillithiol biosynthesis BshC [Planctomycetota bacterium]